MVARSAISSLVAMISPCRLCPRECGAKRAEGELGECGVGARIRLSSAGPHFGEESVLVGGGGSGTLFLSGCNLGCRFCQNWEISHGRQGHEIDPPELAEIMLQLQGAGCVNINWVTPTHVLPGLVRSLAIARRRGLEIPLVYNCGGYESMEALALLDGIVDVYMPDLKSLDSMFTQNALHAADYPEVVSAALVEMQRQVGDLEVDGYGVARRGLLVRHLVLPGGDTGEVLTFLADSVSGNCAVNVMGQYRPEYRAWEVEGLDRFPSRDEVEAARELATGLGLRLL